MKKFLSIICLIFGRLFLNTNNLSVTVDEAAKKIQSSIVPIGAENVSIFDAHGRVIYDYIVSDVNIPPLNNSAMDGYAIIAEDTMSASKETPVKLKITGEIKAGGEYIGKSVTSNNAIRIMTGAPVPKGSDAIIQFEDTSEDGDIVNIFREIKINENYRFAGEDIKKGSTVLNKGHCLKSADIGLLASLNYSEVNVYKRPEVAIISTGDEIADIGENIRPGQIRNSNSYTIYSEVKKYNALPRYLGIAKDTPEDTREKLLQAFECDIVITTGGVSMGKYDFVKDVMSDIGIDLLFERIKMKPGKPFTFGKKGSKLFFGLPGNPVSAMISFIQFVRPAILTMMGAQKIGKPVVNALLEENIKKKPDRTHFIRGYFTVKDGDISVTTTGSQGSGVLRSMSDANCLIILPIGTKEAKAGDRVLIQLINHEEIA